MWSAAGQRARGLRGRLRDGRRPAPSPGPSMPGGPSTGRFRPAGGLLCHVAPPGGRAVGRGQAQAGMGPRAHTPHVGTQVCGACAQLIPVTRLGENVRTLRGVEPEGELVLMQNQLKCALRSRTAKGEAAPVLNPCTKVVIFILPSVNFPVSTGTHRLWRMPCAQPAAPAAPWRPPRAQGKAAPGCTVGPQPARA